MAKHDEAIRRDRDKRIAQLASYLNRGIKDYDQLAQRAKIKWEPPKTVSLNEEYPLRYCAHGVPFTSPCIKCERNDEDCKVYRDTAIIRLRELLAKIGKKE